MARPMRDFACRNCGKPFKASRSDAKYCQECKGKGIHEGKSLLCPDCGGYKYGESQRCHSCENRIKWSRRGEKNHNWKGGTTRTRGYVFIRQGAGHNAKYVQEHRLVWEEVHGSIPEGYVIHHLNGVKDDNRPENLACLPIAAHSGPAIHRAYKTRIRQLEAQLREFQQQNKF